MVDRALLPRHEDIRFFEENGFWLGGKVVSNERLARLREAMDEVYAGRFETGRAPWAGGGKPTDDPLQIRKADNVHWANHMNAVLMRGRGGKDGGLFAGDPWITLYSSE